MSHTLYCFRDSGFSYKVALFLNILQIPWHPIFVNYKKGGTRTGDFRRDIIIQGECPVLVTESGYKLSQSSAIMQYLAEHHQSFNGSTEQERYEIIRWLSFDNHKFSSNIATHRYHYFVSPGALSNEVHDFIYKKMLLALATVENQLGLSSYIAGTKQLSIADLSLMGYLLYPESEFAFSVSQEFPNILRLTNEIRSLKFFELPDDILPSE